MNQLNWINIFAVVASPLFAVWLTRYLADRSDKRKQKMQVFKKLMIARINSATREYVETVNCIDVVFSDCEKVRSAWKSLYEEYSKPCQQDLYAQYCKLIKLIEAIAKDLGYKNIEWDDIIMNSYKPKWLVDELKAEQEYKAGQVALAKAFTNSPCNAAAGENTSVSM